MRALSEEQRVSETRVCPGVECGVSRRDFLGAAMAAAAFLLAGCGDGQIGAGGNPLAATESGAGGVVRLADYPALGQIGGVARVSAAGAPVAVVRVSQAGYLALSLRCPHQGTTVDVSGAAFVCPNHGARFDSAGRWTGGERTGNLVPVPLTVDAAAGTLTLGGGVAGAPGAGGTTSGDDDDDEEEDEDGD